MAAEGGSFNIVKYLVEKGAVVDITDANGVSNVHYTGTPDRSSDSLAYFHPKREKITVFIACTYIPQ